ncbi:MAG: YciI family protein [Halothiobacillus sp.]
MYFVILATDQPDSLPQRLAYRAEHRARLDDLLQEGRLITAGPMPSEHHPDPLVLNFRGSMIIAAFPDFITAQTWANADPYVLNGVYAEVSVTPYLATYWASPPSESQPKV